MPFRFFQPTKIHFGVGSIDKLGGVTKTHGSQALLVTMSNSDAVMRPIYERVSAILTGAGLSVTHFDGAVPNPSIASIMAAIGLLNENHCDVIVAVGGGSSIDTAKAVSLFYGENAIDWANVFSGYTDPFASYTELSKPVLPVIAVPTTAGTGSEVTQAMIISDPDNDEKNCIFHDKTFPRECVIDPALTVSMPRGLTAMTGFDAFSHAFESYMRKEASDYTKTLGARAMKTAMDVLPKLMVEPQNIELREKMSLAAFYAGISLANAAASIPHPLSEIVGGIAQEIPHGQCLASLYPAYVKFEALNNTAKCAELAKILNPALDDTDEKTAANALVDMICEFIAEIGLNKGLTTLGVTDEQKERMSAHFLFNVLPFAPKDTLIQILLDSF